ncbi:tensin-3 isoform X1 [Boleophthalmus pectinirostris]|uniref:tensin-3 isoform X1 n=2 Tax=Boleophthalmus pectinirostris TaxID=150288 RepID=UPI000A1C21F0|nr:tensin-3 isoform X1 [Boleophthalmus pectinirostris]XP_055020404.1 tensin-3 isoform X1 [Boleophthalmus pectinirostris]
MEEALPIDLTYITERIITVVCPRECSDSSYLHNLSQITHMLHSKHGHNYMFINLSNKNEPFSRLPQKVVDTGWTDQLAPNLDQIINVCTAMENWLHRHHKHVLVLHSWGGKGLIGVLLASYIHFSNLSSSADLSLDHFAMRRFFHDKLAPLMTPSQKRYVWMLGSMLKGGLRMCPNPSFLLCVVLHSLPKIRPDGGCSLFLRVYQSLQAVCTSAVYHVNAAQIDRLYFVLQPAQLLKGDIMVVCYDKNWRSSSRQVVFRLQFHTGLVHGHSLTFFKADLDCASEDSRFPENGKVELFFSDSPEKIAGRELWHNGRSVTVDYDTLDPVVRRDSYQDISSLGTGSSLNGGIYAKVRKPSSKEGPPFTLSSSPPSCSERFPSGSSDSGLSVASQGPTRTSHCRPYKLEKLGACFTELELAQSSLRAMTELTLSSGGEGGITGDESGLGQTENGETSSTERETDILDDEEELRSALERPSSSSMCSLSSEEQPVQSEKDSTQSWIQQQQKVVSAVVTRDLDGDHSVTEEREASFLAPDAPVRGSSSREAVQRGLQEDGVDNKQSPCQDEELASLATDIDESIEQLNQLILDLDPTFVPVPTKCSPLSRSASLHSNGLSHKGLTHLTGWKQQKQFSDVTDYCGGYSPEWRAQSIRNSPSPLRSPSYTTQHGNLYKTNSVDYAGQTVGNDLVPPTPSFPVSPTTPYVKHFSEFSQIRSGGQWDQHIWTQDSRSFLDSMNHASSAIEGDVPPASCQRSFGSMYSMSSNSPLPHTDSSTPPPVWQDRSPNSLNSPHPTQPSPPLSLSSPKAHSSPRGALKFLGSRQTDSTDLSSLLGNGSLEHSLLEAMEGLEGLGLIGDGGLPPLLPEKRRAGEVGDLGSRSPSLSGFSSPHSGSSLSIPFSSSMSPDPLRGLGGAPSPGPEFGSKQDTVKFVQDTSKFWYKPDISRDQAIALLKDKEPGSFIVRDSHSFRGAYGLAMKVATPPPSVVQQSKKAGDMSNELVRHFLIECTQKGVRLKGCPNEPYFGSLTALVCQHSITPLALPCKLILPDRDPMEELNDSTPQTATNSAAELLKQGAACNVWYLGSVELESLTGLQAVQKATTVTLAKDPPPPSTVVHFKVSAQGITLTDNQRKLFFRRHYAVNTVIFCSLDPQGRKWKRNSGSTAKIFGFVARKSQSETENMCHLFAEHDPEQPASAIVNFVSKVMIGSHKK